MEAAMESEPHGANAVIRETRSSHNVSNAHDVLLSKRCCFCVNTTIKHTSQLWSLVFRGGIIATLLTTTLVLLLYNVCSWTGLLWVRSSPLQYCTVQYCMFSNQDEEGGCNVSDYSTGCHIYKKLCRIYWLLVCRHFTLMRPLGWVLTYIQYWKRQCSHSFLSLYQCQLLLLQALGKRGCGGFNSLFHC